MFRTTKTRIRIHQIRILNRRFAWWRHLTTTTRMLCLFCTPSKKNFKPNQQLADKPWPIHCLFVHSHINPKYQYKYKSKDKSLLRCTNHYYVWSLYSVLLSLFTMEDSKVQENMSTARNNRVRIRNFLILMFQRWYSEFRLLFSCLFHSTAVFRKLRNQKIKRQTWTRKCVFLSMQIRQKAFILSCQIRTSTARC
jgi:hypothetical protein